MNGCMAFDRLRPNGMEFQFVLYQYLQEREMACRDSADITPRKKQRAVARCA